jgi:hypothetical protein
MVFKCEEYSWSSTKGHARICSDPILDPTFDPHDITDDWLSWINGYIEDEEQIAHGIRIATNRGQWLGTGGTVP